MRGRPISAIARNQSASCAFAQRSKPRVSAMNGIIYLVGLVVVVMAVLSVLGLR
jgi:predicted nucleic acid-binding Zn ribbon protein